VSGAAIRDSSLARPSGSGLNRTVWTGWSTRVRDRADAGSIPTRVRIIASHEPSIPKILFREFQRLFNMTGSRSLRQSSSFWQDNLH
jgi:hypothetical protein